MSNRTNTEKNSRSSRSLARNALTNCPTPLPSTGVSLVPKRLHTSGEEDRSLSTKDTSRLSRSVEKETRRNGPGEFIPGYLRPDNRTNASIGTSSRNIFERHAFAPSENHGTSQVNQTSQDVGARVPQTNVSRNQSEPGRSANETKYFSANETINQGLERSIDLLTALENTFGASLASASEFLSSGSFLNSTERSNISVNSEDQESSSSHPGTQMGSRISNDASTHSAYSTPYKTRSSQSKNASGGSPGLSNQHSNRRSEKRNLKIRRSPSSKRRDHKSPSGVQKKSTSFKRSEPTEEVEMQMTLAREQLPQPGEHIRTLTVKALVDGTPVEHNIDILIAGGRKAHVQLREVWLDEKLLFRKN